MRVRFAEKVRATALLTDRKPADKVHRALSAADQKSGSARGEPDAAFSKDGWGYVIALRGVMTFTRERIPQRLRSGELLLHPVVPLLLPYLRLYIH